MSQTLAQTTIESYNVPKYLILLSYSDKSNTTKRNIKITGNDL
jgi:hypothetical protein